MKKTFAPLIDAGVGAAPNASKGLLGVCVYEWMDQLERVSLGVFSEGVEYVKFDRSIGFKFQDANALAGLPNLREIHGITSSRDVWRYLEFTVILDGGTPLAVRLPYMIYSIFCPFLARVIREGKVSGRKD